MSTRVSWLFFASRNNAHGGALSPRGFAARIREMGKSHLRLAIRLVIHDFSGFVIPVAISESPQALLQQLLSLTDLGAVVPPQ